MNIFHSLNTFSLSVNISHCNTHSFLFSRNQNRKNETAGQRVSGCEVDREIIKMEPGRGGGVTRIQAKYLAFRHFSGLFRSEVSPRISSSYLVANSRGCSSRQRKLASDGGDALIRESVSVGGALIESACHPRHPRNLFLALCLSS